MDISPKEIEYRDILDRTAKALCIKGSSLEHKRDWVDQIAVARMAEIRELRAVVRKYEPGYVFAT